MAPMKSDVLLVGISGVSSSGKTTLARLLRDIWPRAFVLHEDDFYWPDAQIPVKDGVQDWDCLEAIDLEKLRQALGYIKEHGESPPNIESKEDKNSVGECGVSSQVVSNLKEDALRLQSEQSFPRIAIIDGFLLYSQEMKHVWELLDIRLFLRTSYESTKKRREARSGYVTIEGFWEDPPGYVDKVVWPNYVKEHRHLFVNGDVQGSIDAEACYELQLHAMPSEADHDMTTCLDWANEIMRLAISGRQP